MSLLLNFSRMTVTGLVTRSSLNKFSTHPQSRASLQRNVAICFHGVNELQDIATAQSTQHNPRRCFYSRGSWQRQVDGKNGPPKQVAGVDDVEEPAKLGLFARFRKMYKEYWYVLVPVHCVTSVFWFGGFYYASQSGVDVIGVLESMGVSEKLIDPVRDSSLGHIAVAYLLYKIATPARYTVTLGGTTVSIKYLVQWGYIKPMPSKAQLVQMYKDKKENFQERMAERKETLQDKIAEKKQDFEQQVTSIKEKKGVTDQK